MEAERARMAQFQIQHEQRLKMAKDFMDEAEDKRMTMRDAINLADRAMGLGVTTNISEIDFRDANLISQKITSLVKDWLKNQAKP
jgi:hypothetical protein